MLIAKLSGRPSSPSYQKKIQDSERINLTKENDSLTNCEEVAKEPNDFFVNAVKNLNIPNCENCDSLAENINDPTLKL